MSDVLVLMKPDENRQTVLNILSVEHEVIIPENRDKIFELVYGTVLTDSEGLQQCYKDLLKRKQLEFPVAMPVLLCACQKDIPSLFSMYDKSIDELITLPVNEIELRTRVDSLLKIRRMSKELKRFHEGLLLVRNAS